MESKSVEKQEVQTETDLTVEQTETTAELNPCQGYKVDSITKLHLCNSCSYHKWRNESKPWVKKGKE